MNLNCKHFSPEVPKAVTALTKKGRPKAEKNEKGGFCRIP